MFKGKSILLGVSGGIAGYKAVELLRLLKEAGAEVTVAMTPNAQRFITPLTFQTLAGRPVLTDTFRLEDYSEIEHIAAVDRSDLFVIAPATANIIGKIANGIADEMVTTMVLASTSPLLIAPAMNVHMWENRIVQQNVRKLKELGHEFVGPVEGELACGYTGAGRMAEPEAIFAKIQNRFANQDLQGETILITAGPTQEPIDPVRILTNRSTGKMGYALAEVARDRGAEVILISGPTHLPVPNGVQFQSVETAQEMRDAVFEVFQKATVVIKAAAVTDYRPTSVGKAKIKKGREPLQWQMERTPDILAELGSQKGCKILVGFAAETDHLQENAQAKLKAKNLDLIAANNVTETGAGFGSYTNRVLILDREGNVEDLPVMTKGELAHKILDRIAALLQRRPKTADGIKP